MHPRPLAIRFRPAVAIPVAALLLCLGSASLALAVPATRNFIFKANKNEYPPAPGNSFGAGYSACWSYVHGDGREYAVIGTTNGTAIYNVTNPDSVYRVAHITGPNSSWREMKSYRDWIYIVTEGSAAGTGVQIVRMTNPESPLHVATYTTNFVTAHTVSIDTARALLVCNGTRNTLGQATGIRILSLASPEAPVQVGWWPGGGLPVSNALYVHDCTPVGNRIYASSINSGIQRILDFTNPAAVTEIHSWTYPGAFSHNCWPDASGSWLYVTDEVNGEPLKIFDISSETSPVQENAITSNPQAIVHNAVVQGGELFLANYTEGIRVLDLSDPLHPAEFGWADSYPGASGGFFGVWGVCPFFPSGTVIASDMQTGLYVYRLARDYGIVRAVVDTGPGLPVAGAKAHLTSLGDSLTTPADGIVQFAPGPGSHTVTARKFGFFDASAMRTVSVGSRDTVELTLVRKPSRAYEGSVRQAGTLTPLETAELDFLYTPLETQTDALGEFALGAVPEDLYRVELHCPGHRPSSYLLDLDRTFPPTHDMYMVPAATYDAFESASGWTVGGAGTGDNATTGIWVRVEPMGTGEPQPGPNRASGPREEGGANALAARAFAARLAADPIGILHEDYENIGVVPGDVQPEFDRSPPPGQMCWVTGQGTTPGSIGEQDVDNGKTSLTSPAYDLTGMAQPTIGYWRWLYASGQSDDWFAVLISNDNGATWVSVDSTRGIHNRWEERTIRVSDHVTPTSQVRVRFIAADLSPGTIVEAALDDFIVYDAAVPNVAAPDAGRVRAGTLRFGAARPNPARGAVRLALEVPRACDLAVEVLDVGGRRVRTLHRGPAGAGPLGLIWDGTDEGGRTLPAGLYFARATGGGESAQKRIVRVR